MKRLILMRGIPGSGKSHLADLINQNGTFSTDEFWYDEAGVYRFDPSNLSKAHASNVAQVERMLARFDDGTYIVDNTNINPRDMEPYFDLAVKYNAEVSIVQVDTPLEVCLARNAVRTPDRRVPNHVIERMYSNFHKPVSVGQLLNQAKERAKNNEKQKASV